MSGQRLGSRGMQPRRRRGVALAAACALAASVALAGARERPALAGERAQPSASETGMHGPVPESVPGPLLQGPRPPSALALLEPAAPWGGTAVMQGLLRFYRQVVSPVDGDRCDMIPTCSLYSHQALQEHGVVLGVLLTADRLLHEADEQIRVTPVREGRELHYPDPLAHNTYWLPTWLGGAGATGASRADSGP